MKKYLPNNNDNAHNDADADLRALIKSATVKAPENLQHRIMRQVEMENALTRKKAVAGKRAQGNVLSFLGTIAGLMYLTIAVMAAWFYFMHGKESLLSMTFVLSELAVVVIFSFIGLVTQLDVYVRGRRRNRRAR